MTGKHHSSRKTGAILLLAVCMVGGYFFGHLRGFGGGMVKFFTNLMNSTSSAASFSFNRMDMTLLWDLSGWMLVTVAMGLLHRRFRQLPTLCAVTGAGCVLLGRGIYLLLTVGGYWDISLYRTPVAMTVVMTLLTLDYPGLLLLGYGVLRFSTRLATGAPEAPRERLVTGAALLLVLLSMAGGMVSGYLDGSKHGTNLISFGPGVEVLSAVETNPVLRASKLPDHSIVYEYVPGVLGWALATAGMVILWRRLRGAPLIFAAVGSGCMLVVMTGIAVIMQYAWLYPGWRRGVDLWNPQYLGLYLFGAGMVMFATGRAGLADDVHGLAAGPHPPEPTEPREA